jgi:hypothetical protein
MHPPFIFTDHKVDPNTHHRQNGRKFVRRHKQETLRITPATTGWPPVPLIAPSGPLPLSPSGRSLAPGVTIQIVPPPRSTLRDFIGRRLIHIGQRMILQNRLG